MVQKISSELDDSNDTKAAYMYYLMMKSGRCSPTSDTLDSGTGSDLETSSSTTDGHRKHSSASLTNAVTNSIQKFSDLSLQSTKMDETHSRIKKRTKEVYNTDSEESESSLSCDSLNSSENIRNNEIAMQQKQKQQQIHEKSLVNIVAATRLKATFVAGDGARENDNGNVTKINFLPRSLLRDIRDHSLTHSNKQQQQQINCNDIVSHSNDNKVIIKNYGNYNVEIINRNGLNNLNNRSVETSAIKATAATTPTTKTDHLSRSNEIYENDKYYKFHINEQRNENEDDVIANGGGPRSTQYFREDDTFAGYRDISARISASAIRSSKGTIRGVKNRVRNGIVTFLQMQQSNVKSYKEKDAGKVVLYSTSMGIVRETYAKCANVKQILRTLLIKFEERDVFMSNEYQQEIKDRMQMTEIHVPQLFVDGQHIGDADQVERLNESGELRKMLKIYKSLDTSYTCQICGGYRLLPCPSCSGSKKSVHRNHFTTEFVALKCMNCDEVGLIKCYNCN